MSSPLPLIVKLTGIFALGITFPFSSARARVEPGRTTTWHALSGTTERYVILDGRGRVEIGDLPPRDVKPGDVVIIPAGCRQRIASTGAGDLIFLAVCTPRFRPENYADLQG